jgi:dCMP deaminase
MGIKEVVYLSDKYASEPMFVAARKMFDMAKVKCRQLKPTKNHIELDLKAE